MPETDTPPPTESTSITNADGSPPVPSLAEFQTGLEQVFANRPGARTADPHAVEGEEPTTEPTTEPTPTPNKAEKQAPSKPSVADLPQRGPKAAQWKEVNDERARLRQQVTKLEADLKTYHDRDTDFAQLEPLKAKVAEYDKILREVAAERHPELIGPIQAKVQAATELAKKAVTDPELQQQVLTLLRQPQSDERDEALQKVMDDLPQIRRGRLEKAILDIDAAQDERASLSSRSAEAINQRQEADRQRRSAVLKEFDVELADWIGDEKGLDILRTVTGNNEHNTRAKEIVEKARQLYGGNVQKPRDVARAALWASVAPYVVEQNNALLSELEKVKGEIGKLRAMTPGFEGQGSAATTGDETGESDLPKGETLSERLVRGYIRAGGQIGR